MSYTITDQDLIHYVEETLPEPGWDVAGIVNELRPYITFGDAYTLTGMTDEEEESFWHTPDKHSFLIERMLKENGVNEDKYWQIVARHEREDDQ
jgi:hypothetical protein